MVKELAEWSKERPFLMSLCVMLLIVIPAFLRMQTLNERIADQADTIDRQVDRNVKINACLVSYVTELTLALQERDDANITSRDAGKELWKEVQDYLKNPKSNTIDPLLKIIQRYRNILDAVSATGEANPYPDIESCLPDTLENEVSLLLASAGWDPTCWGRRPTIKGTFGDDIIHGTDSRDIIIGFSGNDLIVAGKGNDLICGRTGNDVINGGQGFDKAKCGRGADFEIQTEVHRSCG